MDGWVGWGSHVRVRVDQLAVKHGTEIHSTSL